MADSIPTPAFAVPTTEIPLVDRGSGFKEGTALYLVRHGESMTNTYEGIQTFDPNLTALGWAQVLRVADWMAEHAPVDVVVTSPLRRAFSTALAIAHAQGLKPVEVPGLEEFSHEFWEEIPPHHPTRPWWGRSGWDPSFEQAPSFVAFRDRVHEALAEVLERFGGQRVCIVSHGGTMGVLIAAMVGSAHMGVWNDNTGISLFVWPEWQRWLMHYVNRNGHLLGLDAADYPRVTGATPAGNGFWRLPAELNRRPTVDPRLAYLANRMQRQHRILFLFPPDPFTPVRVSLRARRAIVVSRDVQMLEAGELHRALLNANHIRFEYLFLPLPYPDGYFHTIVIGNDDPILGGLSVAQDSAQLGAAPLLASEIERVLATSGEVVHITGSMAPVADAESILTGLP